MSEKSENFEVPEGYVLVSLEEYADLQKKRAELAEYLLFGWMPKRERRLWTQDEKDSARRLRANGYSNADIAKELGRTTEAVRQFFHWRADEEDRRPEGSASS